MFTLARNAQFLVLAFTFRQTISLSRAKHVRWQTSDDTTISQYGGLFVATIAQLEGPWGFDLDGRNTSVAPGDNFYAYANGRHLQELEIPSDMSEWGTFDAVAKRVKVQCRDILESARTSESPLGQFYHSTQDVERLRAVGLMPVQPPLAEIRGMQNISDFAALAGASSSRLLFSPFRVYVLREASSNLPSYTLHVEEGELGMSGREYYLEDHFQKERDAYAVHVSKLLELVGWNDPQVAGTLAIGLEKKMASAALLEASSAHAFDWEAFRSNLGIPAGNDDIEMKISDGASARATILACASIEELQAWAAFRLARNAAHVLPLEFEEAVFDYQKVCTGVAVAAPRWELGVDMLNYLMGEAVGQAYVNRHFSSERKRAVEQLVSDLKEALQRRIRRATWRTTESQSLALERAEALEILVGHTKSFQSYAGLDVDKGDLFGNVERALAFNWQRQLSKLVDAETAEDKWLENPQVLNAYSWPAANRMGFPASIIQPPFFDPDADMAINYGALGAIIGHEITHLFDVREIVAFGERLGSYNGQIRDFNLDIDGVEHVVHPEMAVMESVCDLGGLTLALDAYQEAERRGRVSHRQAPAVGLQDDEFEGTRRFFLGWAQVMRAKMRPARLRERLERDIHPPEVMRVNLPFRNLDAWYRAFGASESNRNFLPQEKRVRIW